MAHQLEAGLTMDAAGTPVRLETKGARLTRASRALHIEHAGGERRLRMRRFRTYSPETPNRRRLVQFRGHRSRGTVAHDAHLLDVVAICFIDHAMIYTVVDSPLF